MKHHKNDIEIEVESVRDATDSELERIASILFEWWLRQYEKIDPDNTSVDQFGQAKSVQKYGE